VGQDCQAMKAKKLSRWKKVVSEKTKHNWKNNSGKKE
jgi:hypothetical protein